MYILFELLLFAIHLLPERKYAKAYIRNEINKRIARNINIKAVKYGSSESNHQLILK